MHKVKHYKIAFIHNDEHEVKIHQSWLFEGLLKTSYVKARMRRGPLRGHLKDSWEFDREGRLLSYTEYEAFRIRDVYDVSKLTGKGITKFVFMTSTWDNKTLNHMMSHLSNVEGVFKVLDFETRSDKLGPQYEGNQ